MALAAALLAMILTPALGPMARWSPFFFSFLAVLVSAWVGGLGPALVVVVLSIVAVGFRYFSPVGSFAVTSSVDLARLGLFAFNAVLVALLVEYLKRARERALVHASDASVLAEELQQQAAELEYQAEEAQAMTRELEQSNADLAAAQSALQAERDEARRLYAEAERERNAAEAANRAKSEFLTMMSHELRTPLNAIAGYTELLEMGIRGPINPEQAEDLRRIRRSEEHLLGLINEVLGFAKVESGEILLTMEQVRVEDALAGAEILIGPKLREKRIRYEYQGGESGMTVVADREKLQQIVLNLLSNAAKFTNPGGTVTAGWKVDGATVCIEVRDTGIGIPADKLAVIFDPFVQLDRSLTHAVEGTGLGLTISRDLARAMGGDLTVKSTVGRGSAFVLTLRQGSTYAEQNVTQYAEASVAVS